MAYLGAQPNKTLTKTTGQSFNGTGSATAFTLNRAVNTGEELEVFVDNVQQEPGSGKSYTASGTTLARTTILQSSNSDAAVNWTSGTRTIFCTLPAEKMIFNNASNVAQNFTEQDPNALAFAIALG